VTAFCSNLNDKRNAYVQERSEKKRRKQREKSRAPASYSPEQTERKGWWKKLRGGNGKSHRSSQKDMGDGWYREGVPTETHNRPSKGTNPSTTNGDGPGNGNTSGISVQRPKYMFMGGGEDAEPGDMWNGHNDLQHSDYSEQDRRGRQSRSDIGRAGGGGGGGGEGRGSRRSGHDSAILRQSAASTGNGAPPLLSSRQQRQDSASSSLRPPASTTTENSKARPDNVSSNNLEDVQLDGELEMGNAESTQQQRPQTDRDPVDTGEVCVQFR
jgi:hypothetical protein